MGTADKPSSILRCLFAVCCLGAAGWVFLAALHPRSTNNSAAAIQQQPQTDHFNSSRCAPWLAEYEHFHVDNRGAAGAKYLIADAPGNAGVGDHLRAFMYALRVAAGTKRVLLIRWRQAGNLTAFLLPGSRINWTLDGTPAHNVMLNGFAADKDVFQNKRVKAAFRGGGLFTHDPSNKTYLVLQTTLPAAHQCVICPPAAESSAVKQRDYDHVCMFRFLFKASPWLQQKTDEALQQASPQSFIPSSMPDYQAVHLRVGQLHGEAAVVNRVGYGSPMEMLLLSVACGKGQAASAGLSPLAVPIVLLADHTGVRNFAQHGGLAHVVSPAHQALHTMFKKTADAYVLAFVDLNILARAKCVVLSLSGFSNAAWWLSGGNPCMLLLSECYEQCVGNAPALRQNASCPLTT